MDADKLLDEWHCLLFGVRRSIRYHSRRRQFFDRFGFLTNFLIVLTGGGTAISVISNSASAAALGTIVAGLSAVDLIVGCSKASREHHDLARDFSALERMMLKAGESPTSENLLKCTSRRLEIEENEPPKLCVLDLICHNELVKALGHGEEQRFIVKWYQSFCANVLDIFPSRIKKAA